MKSIWGEYKYLYKNSAILALIIINLLFFVIGGLINLFDKNSIIETYLQFHPALSQWLIKPFSIITYAFVHYDFFHILFNLLWLFFIGTILENLVGKKHIFKLWFWGSIIAALEYCIVFYLAPTIYHKDLNVPGASAAVSAIILGTVAYKPNYTIHLFGILPVPIWAFGILRVIYDLASVIQLQFVPASLMHLTAAMVGFLYGLHLKDTLHLPFFDWFDTIPNWFTKKQKKVIPKRSFNVEINTQYKPKKMHTPTQDEIDEILDKISAAGYDSLTKEEKEILFKASDDNT